MAFAAKDFGGLIRWFKSSLAPGSDPVEHVPHHNVDNAPTLEVLLAAIRDRLGPTLGTAADAVVAAVARAQTLAAMQLFNGTTFDLARGSIANGLLVDVSRLPTAIQTALDAIRDRLPVGGTATEATLGTCATALANILAALTVVDAYIAEIVSAGTTPVAFGSQAVKAPVHILIDPAMTGTLTIDDGADGGAGAVVLGWDNVNSHHLPEHVFYVANLNQLRYTFSVNAGTSKFTVSTGI